MGTVSERPIRLGILGLGQMASLFATAVSEAPMLSLEAVASRSLVKAQTFAREFHAKSACAEYINLIQNSEIDLVYICTPPAYHAELAKLCLTHGKGVLVEKPFTTNARDASEVIALARFKKLFCMEAMWMRFLPAFREVLTSISDGKVGTVHHLSADFGIPSQFVPESHHLDPKQGGAWLDRGIYGLSMAVALFGAPTEIVAQPIVGETGCDLQSSAVLRFANGQLATISASFVSYTSNMAIISGDRARICISEPFIRPEQIQIRNAPAIRPESLPKHTSLPSRLKRSPYLRRLKSLLPSPSHFIPYGGNGYIHEATEAVKCMLEGKQESEIMPWEQTIQVMEASDQVRAHWLRNT